jgi:P27 family predicted phage terminase small subunit
VAGAWDPVTDLPLLERYFRSISEYETVFPTFQENRLVDGSKGQPAMNPLSNYLAQLGTEMARCEAALGIGPASRARLGLTIEQVRRTALDTFLDQRQGAYVVEGEGQSQRDAVGLRQRRAADRWEDDCDPA